MHSSVNRLKREQFKQLKLWQLKEFEVKELFAGMVNKTRNGNEDRGDF